MPEQTGALAAPRAGRSILLFGFLALSFDAAAFKQIRKTVVEDDENLWLADVVRELPGDLEAVLSGLPHIFQEPVASQVRKQVTDLQGAFATGRPLDTMVPLPNALLVPLVVMMQLTQYTAFLQEANLEHDCRHDIFTASKSGKETIGLCTGLLSAFAASSARNRVEFRRHGAAAVRLGMLVGLVVDSQDMSSGEARSRSLSVSWGSATAREDMIKIIEESDEAYIPVHYDENRATITTSGSRVSDLSYKLKAAGINATEIGLYGAFHSADKPVLDHVIGFCDHNERFQLPDATEVNIPTKANNKDGTRFGQGALHNHALQSILLEVPHWYDAFAATIRGNDEDVQIISFGPERSIPPSLSSRDGLRIVRHPAAGNDPSGTTTPRREEPRKNRPCNDSDIAVVGMACKVPGADGLEEFWDLLVAGKSQHREIGGESSRFSFEDTPFRTAEDGNMQRKWFANLIDGHNQFDHRFFKKSARESATMDPQQRHLLQVVYQAVEQSGYLRNSESRRDNVGCFIGVCLSDYDSNVECHSANAFSATGNLQGFIAGKVSHFFGWTGPGMTIDSACSSSLVAVHQACRSIISGKCTAALAGGSHIMTSAAWFQNLAAGSFLSPTGQCKPFDAMADGYCRGEGAGAVFLKRMSDAVADGDQILGVIAATAVQQNQDLTPIFVPNKPSLSDLFNNVTRKARVEPSQISVVEAHGTGTAVGDPVEYGSIRQALGGANRSPANPLAVSSVKGLLGHMECTSGIISLVKVLLMLNKGLLPPQASFETPNPALEARPDNHMFIPTRAVPWKAETRIALINNYGASGSNASMVVMQAPSLAEDEGKNKAEMPATYNFPFSFTATDDKGLRRYAKAFRKFVDRSARHLSLGNLSFNLARQSNRRLGQDLVFAARSKEELQTNLGLFEKGDGSLSSKSQSSEKPAVVLCFGGQVATSVGLDRQVYDDVAIMRKHLSDVDTVVQSQELASIFPGIFQRTPSSDTVQLQTMLFALQYACARSWMDSGIRPAALVGHSFGELTALCISQVLSLEDTVKLIVNRAALVRDAWGPDKGAMLAIEADQKDIETLLEDANQRHSDKPASIACYNGPRSFTLAGSTNAIDALEARLEELPSGTIKAKRLNVTNAFHSAWTH